MDKGWGGFKPTHSEKAYEMLTPAPTVALLPRHPSLGPQDGNHETSVPVVPRTSVWAF